MIASTDTVATDLWRLEVPPGPGLGRTICVPTIHPVGDRRVIRCAQAALTAGYDIHFVWLGGSPGTRVHHPRVSETCLPDAASFLDRIRAIPRILRLAGRLDAEMWHIHDFYLLPFAWFWSRRQKRPVIYDVHEYYPEYYAGKIKFPKATRRLARAGILAVERGLSARIGGVNTVSEALAERFTSAGVPAACTPNFPARAGHPGPPRRLTPALLQRVVHTGTLSPEYGSDVILEAARILTRSAPGVTLTVIARFSSDAARRAFLDMLERDGKPGNLEVIDPVPAHRMMELLAGFGIGLVTLQDKGQNSLAVPTKLFEYSAAGLAVVASDMPGIRSFVEGFGVGVLAPPDRPDRFADAITRLVTDAQAVCAEVDEAAARNVDDLSWEGICVPRLRALLAAVDHAPAR